MAVPLVSLPIAGMIWGGSAVLHAALPTLPALAWWQTYAFTMLVHLVTSATTQTVEHITENAS